jgi:YD repeat-containing protein
MKTWKHPLPRLAMLLAAGLSHSLPALAAPPPWWTTRGAVNPALPADDYHVLNLGQLKQMASKAREEFDATLPGGAGTAIANLVNGWANTTSADDYHACNLGQLKAVAHLYWDRLVAEGYATASEIPWTPATTDDDDYRPANIGQLKLAFAVSTDRDHDGIPDNWELQRAGNITTLGGTDAQGHPKDYSHDGISDLAAYQISLDPMINYLEVPATTETLSYDAAHRLTSVNGRSTLGYRLDASGNLTQTTP